MCTALRFKQFFGRNLDYEFSYGERITVSPRNYNFKFRHTNKQGKHYAIIGMAYIVGDYPLYYDAINEKGVGMAGLNFVGNTYFNAHVDGRDDITSFEFIPWVLSQCANIKEVKELLEHTNVVNTAFNSKLPPAQLHYMISDDTDSIVIECMKDGMHIYDNPTHVLTNNPPFKEQISRLNDYMYLTNKQPENTFSKDLNLAPYSRGFGAFGLPGDLSSPSRFVRVAFTRSNATSDENDLSQFFHILGSVEQQKGLCEVSEGEYEYTIYSSCCDLYNGIYYYTTYNGHQIIGVDMFKEDLDSDKIISYPMMEKEIISFQN